MNQTKRVGLKQYAAAQYPDLKIGMLVGVERPWKWGDLLPWRWKRLMTGIIAWRIRANESAITGEPATVNHSMIYAGGGNCISQGAKFGVVNLEEYRGAILHFHLPDWSREQRSALIAEAIPYVGNGYDYEGIGGQLLRAWTGAKGAAESVHAAARWYCSEAVCTLVRLFVQPDWAGGESETCQLTPQELYDFCEDMGYPRVTLALE